MEDRLGQYSGVLIVDKPPQFTSFDVCAKLRGMLHTRKIGHAGTLDPMATGVMTVLLGGATKAADLMQVDDKQYFAKFELGKTTDTLDITGEVTSEGRYNGGLGREQIESVLQEFRGKTEQLPPMYSAVHAGGRRLYELARRGVEVERTARPITVHRLELTAYDPDSGIGELDVLCSKGTYIRALTDDIGSRLGCGAVLTALRRTVACGFGLDRALTLAQIEELAKKGTLGEHIIPTDEVLGHFAKAKVTPAQAVRYSNGGELSCERLSFSGEIPGEGQLVRVYGAEFIGLGRIVGDSLRPYKRFA